MSVPKRFILNTLFTGKHFLSFDELPSTNSYAIGIMGDNPPEGTVILAWNQTAGRGQRGNSWQVQSGRNLTFSVIYYPAFLEAKDIFSLSKITSMAIREAIADLLPLQDVSIKWPNDILLNNKKVTGILIENQLEGSRIKSCVIGIGLNVNQQIFPDEINDSATSMRQFADQDFPIEKVLNIVLEKLEAHYLQLKAGRKDHIDRTYLKHLYGYQTPLTFRVKDKYLEGVITGVDAQGRLAVDCEKRLRYFDIKEIQFLI